MIVISVSHVGVTKNDKPVMLLRDTDTVPTATLKNVCSMPDGTDIHKTVLLECFWDTGLIVITPVISEVNLCYR